MRSPLACLRLALPVALIAFLGACTNTADNELGDPPADAGTPSALGNGLKMAQINNPDSGVKIVNDQMNVAVTGAQFLFEDDYSETGSSSSVGSVYVQDFHESADGGGCPPYSGMLLDKTTFQPASLALAPGDVVDFTGEYEQFAGVPPNSLFPTGQILPEFYEPVLTFRFDYSPPKPTNIAWQDLTSYTTGFKWMSMLVTIKGSVGGGAFSEGGRSGVFLTSNTSEDALYMDNELFDLPWNDPLYATNGKVRFTSVTGIVTYFFEIHISPRSLADIQAEPVE